ncbi:hypothetical protein [Mycolicibacterium elephantis]|uniref:Uncharacterized protein n=1 Tax=Mycolicibacterium elephantis DSM 44368 TaxID=1335622 RepID=A0A439DTY2_9MYCO|nr:hypothetical protein [Mycolicibacterium elephantis]MCV7223743.1 hypothetical protein [Mycolicibacterium elephantis]RWA19972.1 hypothetical protein MELE44368_18855 [Mycolicibacterium elephantis DSM 44368]
MAESFYELLQHAYPSDAAGGLRAASAKPARDSQVKIVQVTQYALYVAFQVLVLALAIAVTTSLIIAIWRLSTNPDTAEAILSGVVIVGDIATGAAAGFLQKQANEAKKRYEDARRYLSE